jgi:Raf kinase inhibitor-like YbhB/YbcL family protein
MTLSITSPAFGPFGAIPRKYTCDGDDVSPPLRWAGVPGTARSLALIVEDPDAPDPAAPKQVFVHWVLYNLPASADGLPEGVRARDLPKGTREGRNDWNRTGYGGPCPPIGRHRYFFRLFALDAALKDLGSPTKAELEAAMAEHALETAELIGTYQRGR